MPDHAAEDPSNLLLGQVDGTFVEAAPDAGIASFGRARGAALVDLDLDGLLDLVEVNRGEVVRVWHNVGSGEPSRPAPLGNHAGLRLEQSGPNRDAIGAWLEIRTGERTTHREVTVGGGHVGGQLGWLHLGLGAADRAQVRVRWPDGEVGGWYEVRAGERAIVDRADDTARPWSPPGR
jgi:enediyne biosynthesis protein E4